MLKRLLLLAGITVTLAACKPNQSPNGTYLIYKIGDTGPKFLDLNTRNDTIQRILRGYFQNKHYHISFMDKYVSMKPVDKGSELILSKNNDPNDYAEYKQSLQYGSATMNLRVGRDDNGALLLAVSLYFPNKETPFMPIQMPTNDRDNKHGFIICHLTKSE